MGFKFKESLSAVTVAVIYTVIIKLKINIYHVQCKGTEPDLFFGLSNITNCQEKRNLILQI